MRYLIDNNTLSNTVLTRSKTYSNVFTIEEVVEEYAFMPEDANKIRSAGIQVLSVGRKHIKTAKQILEKYGDDLNLIRLYTNKGQADIMLLAYILAEKNNPETLFTEEYTLVTKDKELTKVSESYGIKCIEELVDNSTTQIP